MPARDDAPYGRPGPAAARRRLEAGPERPGRGGLQHALQRGLQRALLLALLFAFVGARDARADPGARAASEVPGARAPGEAPDARDRGDPPGGRDEGDASRARVRLEAWAADAGGQRSAGGAGGFGLDFDPDLFGDLRLDLALAWSRPGWGADALPGDAWAADGPPLAVATLRRGAARLQVGRLDDDLAVHLGWAPARTWEVAAWARLEGALDLSLGAARLGRSWGDATDAGPGPARGAWAHLRRAQVDALGVGLAPSLALVLRPLDRLEVAVAGRARAFLAGGAPDGAPAPPGLEGVARWTRLDLAATLSEAAVGGAAAAWWRLATLGPLERRVTLRLGYVEDWDWPHQDLAWSLAAAFAREGLAELGGARPGWAPWRVRRTVALAASIAGGAGDGPGGPRWTLDLRLDATRTRGLTAIEGPFDRDGDSLGLAATLRTGRAVVDAWVRHHLDEHPLAPALGAVARTSAGAQLAVRLVDGRSGSVDVELGGALGVADGWGLRRDGWVVHGGLAFAFGGARDRPGLGAPPPWRGLARPGGPLGGDLASARRRAPAPVAPTPGRADDASAAVPGDLRPGDPGSGGRDPTSAPTGVGAGEVPAGVDLPGLERALADLPPGALERAYDDALATLGRAGAGDARGGPEAGPSPGRGDAGASGPAPAPFARDPLAATRLDADAVRGLLARHPEVAQAARGAAPDLARRLDAWLAAGAATPTLSPRAFTAYGPGHVTVGLDLDALGAARRWARVERDPRDPARAVDLARLARDPGEGASAGELLLGGLGPRPLETARRLGWHKLTIADLRGDRLAPRLQLESDRARGLRALLRGW